MYTRHWLFWQYRKESCFVCPTVLWESIRSWFSIDKLRDRAWGTSAGWLDCSGKDSEAKEKRDGNYMPVVRSSIVFISRLCVVFEKGSKWFIIPWYKCIVLSAILEIIDPIWIENDSIAWRNGREIRTAWVKFWENWRDHSPLSAIRHGGNKEQMGPARHPSGGRYWIWTNN